MSEIEELRQKLHRAIEEYGLNSKEVYMISVKMDSLLNKRGYTNSNTMYNAYLDSMFELRKISKIFGEFPTIDEWNKYAKENYLLNSESIKYISGLDWNKLRNQIKKEMNIKSRKKFLKIYRSVYKTLRVFLSKTSLNLNSRICIM